MKKAILLLLILVFVLAMSGVALAVEVPYNSNGVENGSTTSYNYNNPLDYSGGTGPHGGFATGTNMCRDCHAVHRAKGSFVLLRANNRVEACDYCHGVTGGGAPVNIAWADTGVSNGHHGGWNAANDGDANDYAPDTTRYPQGSGDTLAYKVPAEGFACMDCHSPHGTPQRTVAGIVERTALSQGNALLLGRPNKNGTPETALDPADNGEIYSWCGEEPDMSQWCATCHMGNYGLYSAQKDIRDNVTSSWDVGYSHDCETDGTTTPGDKYDTCDKIITDDNYMKVEPDTTNDGPKCRQCHDSSTSGSTVWPHKSSGYVLLEDGTSTSNPRLDDVCTDCHHTDALP